MFAEPAERMADYVAGRYGPPAFIRRQLEVDGAWDALVARTQSEREKLLFSVRIASRAAETALGLPQGNSLDASLEQVRRAAAPLAPSQVSYEIRAAVAELARAVAQFNRRWQVVARAIDLRPLNRLREDYNKYFLVEKEAALRSAEVARMGYRPMRPATLADILEIAPPLTPLPAWESLRARNVGLWDVIVLIGVSYAIMVFGVLSLANGKHQYAACCTLVVNVYLLFNILRRKK
ncbi:MAG: hypothetical protein K1X57_14195 [Gemmataceae bacterium]|nr:hypothetical protein [Gemmataceae bacterium]